MPWTKNHLISTKDYNENPDTFEIFSKPVEEPTTGDSVMESDIREQNRFEKP
jgi:hypothetical protein